MEKFLFLHTPEHIAFVREKSELLPVLSYEFSEDDTGRILGWLKRRGIKSYSLFNRNITFDEILSVSSFFDGIFIFNPDIALKLRRKGYLGEIFLFSSFADIHAYDFMKNEKIRPVAYSSKTYKSFEEKGLKPVLVLTSRKCIADVGTCISHNGTVQDFTSCDIRCREKCSERHSAERPFSLKPDFSSDNMESVFIYNEKFSFPEIRTSEKNETIDSQWNYTWPIGYEIISKAEKVGAETWLFKLNEKEKRIAGQGVLGIYCYNDTMYNGEFVEPVKLNNFGSKVFAVIDMSVKQFEKVMLCITQTHDEQKMFKNARHFIYTMPENNSYKKSFPKELYPSGKTGKGSVIAIIDDTSKASVFRKGFINEFIYDLPFEMLPSGGNISWLLNWNCDDTVFDRIAKSSNIKKIYVHTETMYFALKAKLSENNIDVAVLPLYLNDKTYAPNYFTRYLTIFVSPYNTLKSKNYEWKSLGVSAKNRKNHTLFIENKSILLKNGSDDLWIDTRNASASELAGLKKEAETIKNSLKGIYGK